MNQVLKDRALNILRCAHYSQLHAISPTQSERERLEAAVLTLERLMSNPSSDALYELKVRTACREVFLNLMD